MYIFQCSNVLFHDSQFLIDQCSSSLHAPSYDFCKLSEQTVFFFLLYFSCDNCLRANVTYVVDLSFINPTAPHWCLQYFWVCYQSLFSTVSWIGSLALYPCSFHSSGYPTCSWILVWTSLFNVVLRHLSGIYPIFFYDSVGTDLSDISHRPSPWISKLLRIDYLAPLFPHFYLCDVLLYLIYRDAINLILDIYTFCK